MCLVLTLLTCQDTLSDNGLPSEAPSEVVLICDYWGHRPFLS